MVETDSNVENQKLDVQKRLKEIESKSNKVKSNKPENIAIQLATRAKLERDYIEDKIYVSFKTSPETTRTLVTRRPNNEEYLSLIKLGIEASKFQSNSLAPAEDLANIISKLGELAAELCVDTSLDAEFWNKKVSSSTLQNFINAIMSTSQSGYSGISEEELKTFRGE